jgi:ribosomal protein S1
MASNINTTSNKAGAGNAGEMSREAAWDELTQRLSIGEVVEGVVEDIQPYGVFFNIGERFPGFLDVLEVPADLPEAGRHVRLEIAQFADWNRQIRVTLTDDRPNKSE